MIDRSSGLAVYRQVAESLRAKVLDGTYPPGEKLPSERELVEKYGVSKITVREAIKMLRVEGLVSAEHGRGVFVRPRPAVTRLSRNRLSRASRAENKGAFLGDAETNRFTPTVEVTVTFEPANRDFAEALAVDEGTEITVRQRVMSADGLPVQLATSRLPRALTRGTAIEQDDTGSGGIYGRLEETGHVLDHFVETVGTRMPTPGEVSRLQLAQGTPILTVRRIAFDSKGTPVEVNDMRLAGNKYELRYEFPAD